MAEGRGAGRGRPDGETPEMRRLRRRIDALDRRISDDVLAWIGERTAAGATVAVVSHAIEPFMQLATGALTMRDGQVEAIETLPAPPQERFRLLDSLARG